MAPQFFGNAGREHMEKYGTTPEHFAKIGHKNHKHSVNNPQCCPTSDGAGAAIVVSEDFIKKHKLQAKAVEILGMAMTADFTSTFDDKSSMKLVGYDMTKAAARKVYEQSGVGPEQVDVVELRDCFSANELITYEALGLCPEGKAGEFIDSGANTYGGKVVVNRRAA